MLPIIQYNKITVEFFLSSGRFAVLALAIHTVQNQIELAAEKTVKKTFIPPNVLTSLMSHWREFLTLMGRKGNQIKTYFDPIIPYLNVGL